MSNMEFAKWIEKKLEDRKLNPTQLAEAIGENQPTLQRILSGVTKNPRLKIIKKIEDFFNDKFESNTEPSPDIKGKVPIISWVQAGSFNECIDDLGECEQIATDVKVKSHTFALRVTGDSMTPQFTDGMIIVVEPEMHPSGGFFTSITFAFLCCSKNILFIYRKLYVYVLTCKYEYV